MSVASVGCEAKVAWQLRRAFQAEALLEPKALDVQKLVAVLEALQSDICPASTEGI